MATLPSARLFDAATKLRAVRGEIAKAKAEVKDKDDQAQLELLHEELSDLNWRTQSLAMRRQRDEKRQGQYKGPLTPATDFPDYDSAALTEAKKVLAEEQEDLADQAASLPPAPTVPDVQRGGLTRRAYDAVTGLFGQQHSAGG